MKNTNLVRIGKVSFFDLGVSRKSPPLWHFLAVFPALNAVDAEPARHLPISGGQDVSSRLR